MPYFPVGGILTINRKEKTLKTYGSSGGFGPPDADQVIYLLYVILLNLSFYCVALNSSCSSKRFCLHFKIVKLFAVTRWILLWRMKSAANGLLAPGCPRFWHNTISFHQLRCGSCKTLSSMILKQWRKTFVKFFSAQPNFSLDNN